MTEIYSDIPDEVKEGVEFIVNLALLKKNPIATVKMVRDYANTLLSDYEREYVDFYFNLRLEQIRNESNNDNR